MSKMIQRKIDVKLVNKASTSVLVCTIRGISEYIQKDLSEKVKKGIAEGATGKKAGAKKARNPMEEYLDAFITIGPKPKTEKDIKKVRFGHYGAAFVHGLIRAAKKNQIAMSDVKGIIFVRGVPEDPSKIEIHADKQPYMREDAVRNSAKGATIAYRPAFPEWHANLEIEFCNRVLSPEQMINLLEDMGNFNGIGEWRPFGRESSGWAGRFTIEQAHVLEPEEVVQEREQKLLAATKKKVKTTSKDKGITAKNRIAANGKTKGRAKTKAAS